MTDNPDIRHVERLAALAELVLPQEDLQQVLSRVTETASSLLPAYGASVILWDERAEVYTISNSTLPGQKSGHVVSSVRSSGGATRWIIDHRTSLVVPDVARHPLGSSRLVEDYGVRSFVGVPLLYQDEVLGVLYALDQHERDHSTADLDFLAILAHRAASAIGQTRLREELEHALARTDALARVGQALIRQGHDLDALLDRLCGIAAETVEASQALLLLVETEQRRVDRFITAGAEAHRLADEGYESYERGLTGWVLRNRRTVVSPVGVLDPRQGETEGEHSRRDAIVVAPITDEHRIAGTLTVVRSATDGDFDEREVALLEAFADQASLAIAQARMHAVVRQLAVTDELTALPNRRRLYERGREAFALSERHRRPLAVAVIDIDHFKRVNDRFGHAIGDEVLRQLAERALGSVRGVDTFGRVGGEEFALILPETELAEAVEVSERLRRAVASERFETARGALEITVTVGVAAANDRTASLDELFELADAALYRGKQAGRNRVVVAEAP